MLIRPDSPGLKFMLLGNSGDAGFFVDGQLMTLLWFSRFQQARREAETGLVVFGTKRPPQEVYAAVWARLIRRALDHSRWVRCREAKVVAVVRLLGKHACWSVLGTAAKWGAGLAAGSSFHDFIIG